MARSRRTRIALFLPDHPDLERARGEVLAGLSGARVVRLADLPQGPERAAALEAELAAGAATGYVVVDPPRDRAGLEQLDAAARRALGRRGLPHGVFFAPPPAPRRGEDPWAAHREAFRELHEHYRRDRRSVTFEKPRARELQRAVKAAARRHSLLRWALLAPMAAVLVGLLLVVFVFRDPLLRRGAVAAGQMAFGARVDIDLLTTDLEPELDLRDVAVADRDDPLRDLFRFDRLHSDINIGALFGGRVHLHEARLEGLRFDQPRETSGALPGLEVRGGGRPEGGDPAPDLDGGSASRLEELLAALRAKLEPPALEELETVREARALEQEAAARLERLRALAGAEGLSGRLDAARARIAELSSIAVPASVQSARQRLEGLGGLASGAELTEARQAIEQASDVRFSALVRRLDEARARRQALETSLAGARATIEEAAGLRKLSLGTAARLPGLIRDVGEALETLEGFSSELESIASDVTAIQRDLTALRTEGSEALERARSALQRAAGGASSELAAAWQGLQQDLEQARADAAGARQRLAEAVAEAAALVEEVRTGWEALQAEASGSREFLEQALGRLEAAAARDRAALEQRYSFADWKVEELLAPLVGEEALGWLERAWGLHARLAPFLGGDGDGPGPEAPPTVVELPDGGRRYVFPADPERIEQPGLWIELAVFEGQLDLRDGPLNLEGRLTDLTTAPALVGRPMRAEFTATQGERRLEGTLTRGLDGVLALELAGSGQELTRIGSGSPYAPRLERPAALGWRLEASLSSGDLRGTLEVRLEGLELQLDGAGVDPRLAAPFRALWADLESLTATVRFAADRGGLGELTVESDLGPRIQTAFEEALAAQLAETLERARSELEGRLAGPRGEALAAVGAFTGGSEGLLGDLGPRIEELSGLLDLRAGESRSALDLSLSLPEPGDAPPGAPDPAELAALEQDVLEQEQRLERIGGGTGSSAGEVVDELAATEAAKDAARERLEQELQRLKDLRP